MTRELVRTTTSCEYQYSFTAREKKMKVGAGIIFQAVISMAHRAVSLAI